MIGRSGSPSSKATTTSWPTRGMWIIPHCVPAQGLATRIQQELSALFWPWRSQGNWTLTRPYLSVKISSPGLPTTTAVCVPSIRGAGVVRAGRNGSAAGMHWNVLVYVDCGVVPRGIGIARRRRSARPGSGHRRRCR